MNGVTQQDLQFMKWLDSKEGERYWTTNNDGEKVLLKIDWEKTHEEYKKIKPIADNKNVFYSEETWA